MLSIVLPSYNEGQNLRNLLPRIDSAIKSIDIKYEVIVVDSIGNVDGTQNICEKYDCKYVVRNGGNSYGDAVRTGIEIAEGDLVLFMDADGSHSPEFIPELLRYASEFDIVIASRYVNKGHTENNFILTLMSRVLNITYSLVLGLPCKDVSNSYKLYHKHQLNLITLECNNFDIVEEILFKLFHNKKPYKIKEVPYTFKKRMFGKTKRNLFIFILTYLYTITKLRFKSRH
jgi:dolichol-phosphate mannosyltransferase